MPYIESLLQKLSPTIVKTNLMKASLFLTAYECLYVELIDKILLFYATEFGDDLKPLESHDYKEEVLSLATKGKNQKFNASCEWWKKNEILTSEDIQEIKKIREQRTNIAHEIPKILIDPDFLINWNLFNKLKHYITILNHFWGRITIDSLEEFDEIEITDEQLGKGSVVLIDYIEELVNEYTSNYKETKGDQG